MTEEQLAYYFAIGFPLFTAIVIYFAYKFDKHIKNKRK